MLDKKALIEQALKIHYPDWTLEDRKTQLVIKGEDKVPRFTVTGPEMKTNQNDLETFKAMLICYKAANDDKLPTVTAFSDDAKKLWDQAVKEVYANELALGKAIEVKVVPPLPPPAPAKPKLDPAALEALAAAAAAEDDKSHKP